MHQYLTSGKCYVKISISGFWNFEARSLQGRVCLAKVGRETSTHFMKSVLSLAHLCSYPAHSIPLFHLPRLFWTVGRGPLTYIFMCHISGYNIYCCKRL